MQKQRLQPDQHLTLPNEPGVYRYINSENQIIYVGKAKDLKKRVASYFNKSQEHSRKTQKLVSEIVEIEYTVVNSEFDALLLENNLIKEHQPKYNILLKDDKTYPSICITKEPFPRVFSTRRIDKRLGEYFGPYSSVKTMNQVLDLLHKLYKIRTCSLNLTNYNINNGKFKICLEYHIGNCLGPCEGLQTQEAYQEEIAQAKLILQGKTTSIIKTYKELMVQAAANLEFENAQQHKEKIVALENFQNKSLIVNPKLDSIDVFGVISEDNQSFINYLKLEHGAVNISETISVKNKLDTDNEIRSLIFELKKKFNSSNTEILSNKALHLWDEIYTSVPKIGDKKKLVDLSIKNAFYFRQDKINAKLKSQDKQLLVVKTLKADLNLKEDPDHIECFDNSNIQGTNPVASMVCFKNGKPSKKDYRKFHIKTVIGPDDFASMNEIVGRRYKRLKEENAPLPKLIVIDGGKGQLNAACDALKEIGLYGQIPIVGIAKRLEEIYYPQDQYPIHINKKSPSLKLLQHLRDEAHRFAITFHRDTRSKNFIKSELDKIPGIGPKTKEALLKSLGTIKAIKSADQQTLQDIIGKAKSEIVIKYFETKKGD